jgi:START domain
MHLVILLAVATVQIADIDAPSGWATYATRDGITVERRKPDDSRFYEHRAAVDLPGVDSAWADGEIWKVLRGGDMDSLKHRDILAESPDELVIYDQIHTPVVSDRDYTIIVRRRHVGARIWFECQTANERGPAPAAGFVRIPIIRAGWYVEPDGHGGTRLGYFAFSEPGGSVPAWLVRGAQADRSVADVVRMKKRLLGGRPAK